MQLRNGIVLQSKPDIDPGNHIHAVLGDGSVGVGARLQPKVIQEHLVPRRDDAEALLFQLPRIEHSAAAEAQPEDADVAARNVDHHVRVEHDAQEHHDHQEESDKRQLIEKNFPPCPPRPPQVGRGEFFIRRQAIRAHRACSSNFASAPPDTISLAPRPRARGWPDTGPVLACPKGRGDARKDRRPGGGRAHSKQSLFSRPNMMAPQLLP